MAEPESKRIRKFKFIWMAEPGHPPDVGVLHNRPPAAGTHKPLRKKKKSHLQIVDAIGKLISIIYLN